jgi:FkbM family methyltransferase
LNRLGFDLIRHPQPTRLASHVAAFVRAHRVNVVLDVGAYTGKYCQFLRDEVGYTGLIVSFEPCAGSFQQLTAARANDPHWRGYPFGLSDADTAAVLNTYGTRGDFNSVLTLRDHGASAFEVDTSAASTEEVRLHRLDTVWAEVMRDVDDPRVFLKMDTQGHDVAVVSGARDHLRWIVGLQSEVAAVEIYDGMHSMPDVLESYRRCQYVPVGFYPVKTPPAYGLSPEFDVLFKRYEGPGAAAGRRG